MIVELCCLTFFVGGFALYIGFVTSKVKPHDDDRLFEGREKKKSSELIHRYYCDPFVNKDIY